MTTVPLPGSVVVTEVHVELQLGEEVELVVDLQIADRAEDITDILLLIEESDRVLRSELLGGLSRLDVSSSHRRARRQRQHHGQDAWGRTVQQHR